MRWILRIALASLLVALAATPAGAQLYELVGVCKRSFGVKIVCVVTEVVGGKAIEKIVEKNAQDWWDYWVNGRGKQAAASKPEPPAAGRSPQVNDLLRTGQDYRTLMRGFDSALSGSPRGLSDARFTGLLGDYCGRNAGATVCNEFRPLFPTGQSPCFTQTDERSCIVQLRCQWRFNVCTTRAP